MTCEIAVLNRLGVGLAADSAATVGNGEKIFHHAQKIFPLFADIPVAILIQGSAEIMGMPWEIVISSYVRGLGNRRLDRLEQYAESFLRFIEAENSFFSESVQADWFRSSVERYWEHEFVQPLGERLKKRGKKGFRNARKELEVLLKRDHATWHKYPAVEHLGKAYGEAVLNKYAPQVAQLEKHLFADPVLNEELRRGLRQTVNYMYGQRWLAPYDRSGVVFVGMGETEPFPVIQQYDVGSIAAGKLKYIKANEEHISRQGSAIIVPLAQSDVIDLFCRGIDSALYDKLTRLLEQSITSDSEGKRKKVTRRHLEKVAKHFKKSVEEEIDHRYEAPLLAAIDALSRHDLARIAEALVSMTALRRRMSIDQKETVGGAIEVATLSKGHGFRWIKRDDTERNLESAAE